MGESPHVCAYERCGRAFDTPVWLTDRSRKPQETYYACPYCFSKMDESGYDVVDHVHDGSFELPGKDSAKRGAKGAGHREVDKAADRPADCPHELGYLKSRGKSVGVPDGCLTCSKILQCMT